MKEIMDCKSMMGNVTYLFPNKKLKAYRTNSEKSGPWISKRKYFKIGKGAKCENCGATDVLQLHHKYYREALEPWDYPDDAFTILCKNCHQKIDHSRIRKCPSPYREEMKLKPFILVDTFIKNFNQEDISYNKYFDIRYFGKIIDCGYRRRNQYGHGRFDYELILREIINNETVYSDRKNGKARDGFCSLDIEFFRK